MRPACSVLCAVQIPGGWAAQRWGGEHTLSLSFALWSLASLATPGTAASPRAVASARVCVGLAQVRRRWMTAPARKRFHACLACFPVLAARRMFCPNLLGCAALVVFLPAMACSRMLAGPACRPCAKLAGRTRPAHAARVQCCHTLANFF